jgi:hypothetical protein
MVHDVSLGGGFVVGGNVKGLVDKKRLYFSPRASNDARNFFASVDVVGKCALRL